MRIPHGQEQTGTGTSQNSGPLAVTDQEAPAVEVPGPAGDEAGEWVPSDLHQNPFEDAPAFRHGEESVLDVSLVLYVLLDHLQWSATDGGDEVGVRPQRGQPGPQGWELLTQQS